MTTIRIFKVPTNERVCVSFPYDTILNARIKTINGCKWDTNNKAWSLPLTKETIKYIKSVFRGEVLEIDSELEVNEITEITRRNIIDFLLVRASSFHGRLDLVGFLSRVWDLKKLASTDNRYQNAAGDIWQHMVNNYDWDEHYLLYTYFDLPNCPDSVFCRFIENCVHPIVTQEGRNLARSLNELLKKDNCELRAKEYISGNPVYAVTFFDASGQIGSASYEVALSFAGEEREYVEEVAAYLQRADIRVFYDKYEEVKLWGKNLTEEIEKIYQGSARFCIIFISKHYAQKVWTTVERRNAVTKAIRERSEYILPVRFDDTSIPGINPDIVYQDARIKSPSEIGEMVIKKLEQLP